RELRTAARRGPARRAGPGAGPRLGGHRRRASDRTAAGCAAGARRVLALALRRRPGGRARGPSPLAGTAAGLAPAPPARSDARALALRGADLRVGEPELPARLSGPLQPDRGDALLPDGRAGEA